MEARLRQLIGAAAIAGPGLHLLSDVLELAGGGFSPLQLWVNYLGFLSIPFVMVGLYAVQRPRIGGSGLLGAVLYGVAFVYFAFTTLHALSDRIMDYETLWGQLGPVYTAHGVMMVVGGVLFGGASLRAGVLARGAVLGFLVGVVVNLVVGLLPVADGWQILGSSLRNLGLMAIGGALMTRRRFPGNPLES